MSVDLKGKVVKGSFWSLLSSLGYQAFGLIIFIFLSRLLTPGEFGTVAIAVIFVELICIIVRFGLLDIIVRKQDLSDTDTATIFWASFVLASASSLFMYVSAPFWENLFSAGGLAECLRILSVMPLMISLFAVQESMLRRDFRFKEMAIRTVVASLFAGVIAVAMAMQGFGMYSLVAQRVLTALFSLIFLWRVVVWRPKLIFSFSLFKTQAVYGAPLMFSSLLFMGMLKVVEALVGFFLGPAAVGYMRIAGKLQDFVVQFTIKPMTDVSLSTFSQLQDKKKKLRKAYIRMVQVCSVLSFPAFLGMAALAPEMIHFVFGDKWVRSGFLMQILCLGSMSAALNYFFAPMMNAIGQTKVIAQVRFIQFALTAIVVVLCAQINLETVVLGSALSLVAVTCITFVYLRKFIDLSVRQLLISLCPAMVSSLVMGLCVYMLKLYVFAHLPSAVALFLCVAVGAAIYPVVLITLFKKSFMEMKDALMPTILKILNKVS